MFRKALIGFLVVISMVLAVKIIINYNHAASVNEGYYFYNRSGDSSPNLKDGMRVAIRVK